MKKRVYINSFNDLVRNLEGYSLFDGISGFRFEFVVKNNDIGEGKKKLIFVDYFYIYFILYLY